MNLSQRDKRLPPMHVATTTIELVVGSSRGRKNSAYSDQVGSIAAPCQNARGRTISRLDLGRIVSIRRLNESIRSQIGDDPHEYVNTFPRFGSLEFISELYINYTLDGLALQSLPLIAQVRNSALFRSRRELFSVLVRFLPRQTPVGVGSAQENLCESAHVLSETSLRIAYPNRRQPG
jgi:hypothetical protein